MGKIHRLLLLYRKRFNPHFRELIRGTSSSFIIRIGGLFVGYVFMYVVSKTAGTKAWGVFSLSFAVVGFASVLSRLGLDTALLKIVAEFDGQKEIEKIPRVILQVSWIVLLLSLIVGVIMYAISGFLAKSFFHKPELAPYFRMSAFTIAPLSIAYVCIQALQGLKKVEHFVFLDMVGKKLYPLLAYLIIIAIAVPNEWTVILSFVIAMYLLVANGLIWINQYSGVFLTLKKLPFEKGISYSVLFSIALPLALASSMIFIKGWIDTFMLGVYGTANDVGAYNIALRLASLISLPLTAVNSIAAPQFANFYGKHDYVALEKSLQQATKVVFFSSIIFLVSLIILGEYLLGMFSVREEKVLWTFLVLVIGFFINALVGPVGYFLQMTGEQMFFQKITVVITIVGVLLNVFLVPQWGIIGASVSTFIGMTTWNIGSMLYIRYKFGFWSMTKPILRRS